MKSLEIGAIAFELPTLMRFPDRRGNNFETNAGYYRGSRRLGDAVTGACDSRSHDPPENGRARVI